MKSKSGKDILGGGMGVKGGREGVLKERVLSGNQSFQGLWNIWEVVR